MWKQFTSRRNKRRNAMQRKFSGVENLEDRRVLDASGMMVDPAIFQAMMAQADSSWGSDLHADQIGDLATQLRMDLAANGMEMVSFIDSAGDADAFHFFAPETGSYMLQGRMVRTIDTDSELETGDVPPIVGDSNGDGQFDSTDLIQVFKFGHYEDNIPNNSAWEHGDWTGDGEFDSSDLLLAFQAGTYLSDSAPPADVETDSLPAASLAVHLFDANHAQLLAGDADNGVVFFANEGDEFYFSVNALDEADQGLYDFQIRMVGDPPPDDIDQLGRDAHPDQIGDNATRLDFAGGAVILNSGIDTPGDVDSFQFVAQSTELLVDVFDPVQNFNLQVLDQDGAVVSNAWDVEEGQAAGPGLYFLETGATYFVTVSSSTGETGEYLFHLIHQFIPDEPWRPAPDSALGEDIHGDSPNDATKLTVDGYTVVDSFIDEANDIDVFEFTSTG
ncbi:MAG: hypothetical protein KDA87_10565, partial [Planctomycetales bacterium]|nr:hypothetical protein [Planctomycetales bacterium]